MTNLPNSQDLVGGSTQEADFQSALSDLYDVIAEIPHVQAPESLSIQLGSITPSKGFLVVDTENAASSDDLDNIVSTTLGEKIIFVQSTSNARTITLTHDSAGSGKLNMLQGVNVTLEDPGQLVIFRYDDASSTWFEIYNNFQIFTPTSALKAAARLSLGIQDIATKLIGTSTGQVPTADLLGGLAFLNTVTSTQLADGAVTGAKILDDAITLAKLGGQPAGSLLYWDSSGNPQVLPAGADGEVLTAKGVGVAPEWTDGAGGSGGLEVITATGTWTKPAGVNLIKVTLVGGGGGGGSRNDSGAGGGTTSFGTYFSATGGQGGLATTSIITSETNGGVPVNEDYGAQGDNGSLSFTSSNGSDDVSSKGGGSPLSGGGGGESAIVGAFGNGISANSYGAGGGGYMGEILDKYALGGGAGGLAVKYIDVSSVSTVSVTIGARGTAGNTSGTFFGGNGFQGVCIIEYMG